MKKIVIAVLMILGLVGVMGVVSQPVYASDTNMICDKEEVKNDPVRSEAAGCNTTVKITDVVLTVLRAVIGITGLLAVAVIVIAGQRYAVANGDPGKVKQAKDMLTWAIVGVIVAVLAFAIVSFVSRVIYNGQNPGSPIPTDTPTGGLSVIR